MSVVLTPMAFMMGAIFGIVYADAIGVHGTELSIAFAFVGGVVGYCAWRISPLPHHNGGFGMPPAQRQRWGWTTEPAKDQPEPKASEMLSWRPNSIFGIYYADNQPEEEQE